MSAEPLTPHEAELRELSIPELMKELASETSVLVRKELELAKAEMTAKGKRAGIGVGLFGAAGTLGLFAFGGLTVVFIALLQYSMSLWAAALLVTAAYGIAAAVLAYTGREKLAEATPATPQETVESIKEDVQWAKTRAEYGKR